MARICVYDVAASSGGALTVLRDCHARALSDESNEYLFIVSSPKLAEGRNVMVVRFPGIKRSWVSRVRFDVLRAHKVIDEFDPDHVLSLQNTVVPFTNRKQIVYMHNPLPNGLCDLRFSIVHEPEMWARQNLIGPIILQSVRKADGVVVQTEWIKRRLVENCGVDEGKICVKPPDFEIRRPLASRDRGDSGFMFFYPASSAPFKNHEVIVRACEELASMGVGGYRVVLTVDGTESRRMKELRGRSERAGLPIEFHGWIDPSEMGQWYANADCLLFPSNLETWGLPLREAQVYGLPVLSSDLEYAHETVGGYQAVSFFNPTDSLMLARLMRERL